jgi:hypothetical protein
MVQLLLLLLLWLLLVVTLSTSLSGVRFWEQARCQ